MAVAGINPYLANTVAAPIDFDPEHILIIKRLRHHRAFFHAFPDRKLAFFDRMVHSSGVRGPASAFSASLRKIGWPF
jgi:hypothetical protein